MPPLPVLPDVPDVPDVPLLGGVGADGVAFGSLGGVGAGMVASGSGAGAVAGGVVPGVVALSVAPVLVPVSALRSLQPTSEALARMALSSSAVLVTFMVFPFTVSKVIQLMIATVSPIAWNRLRVIASRLSYAGARVRSNAGTSAEISRAR